MNLENFDDLLKLLKEKAIIQNKSFKKDKIKFYYDDNVFYNLRDEEYNKMINSSEFKECKENYTPIDMFDDIDDSCLKIVGYYDRIDYLKNNISDEEYKKIEKLDNVVYDSPQYNAVMEYLKNDFINLSNKFKNNLVKFYNDYFLTLFDGHWMNDFYLLKDIITTYLELKLQKIYFNFPYNDKQKYNKRIKTLDKKCEWYNIPKLQAYERLKFFNHKAKELINPDKILFNSNNSRDNNKIINDLIFELTKIICEESYRLEIPKDSNMRLTNNTSSMYKSELEKYEKIINDKSIKKYTLKP